MTGGKKLNNHSIIEIDNIEKILPEIEEKLSGREKEKAEYDYIRTQTPVLKNSFNVSDEKYFELKNEIRQLNQRAIKLYMQLEPSPFLRFYKKIQHIWRVSKTSFSILVVLLSMVIAVIACYGKPDLQTLSMEAGFSLIILILLVKLPRYRYITSLTLLGMLIFIYVNYVDDNSFRWTLISVGITIIALGIAIHSLNSSEYLEKRLDKIKTLDNKLDQIIKKLK